MKTFEDLQFGQHPIGNGLAARLMFQNGYGISVVRFMCMGRYGSYTRTENEWEVAVLKGTEDDWDLCYDTPITNDVIGYLTPPEVTEIMNKIQNLTAV